MVSGTVATRVIHKAPCMRDDDKLHPPVDI